MIFLEISIEKEVKMGYTIAIPRKMEESCYDNYEGHHHR